MLAFLRSLFFPAQARPCSFLDLMWPRMQKIFSNALSDSAPFAEKVFFSQNKDGFVAMVGDSVVYTIPELRLRRFSDDDDYASIDHEAATAAQKVMRWKRDETP